MLRLGVGTGRGGTFSHLLMRDDAYLHAGTPSAGPWGDEPNRERWCATPESLERTLLMLQLHGTTGASGTYSGE